MSTRPRYVQTQVQKWDDTDINAVVDHVLAGETVTGLLAYPYSFIVRKLDPVTYDAVNKVGTRVYGGPDDEGSVDGADCSAVVQAAIGDIYNVGGRIYFPSAHYTFNTKITFPEYSYSIRLSGDSGWGKSSVLNTMTPVGTIFESTVANDALFDNAYTADLRSAVALSFDHINFIGDTSANSIALKFTNVDQATVSNCCFFGWGYAVYGLFDGTTIAEMPGMLDFHDNLISEAVTTPIYFNKFMQSKIHNNEFEAWGTFTRHIHLIDTNCIQIGNNRFAIGNTNTTEVIYIQTTSSIYCNQIMINDNIVDMGTNVGGIPKYEFIHMDNSTAGPVFPSEGIISRDNMLFYSYAPTRLTDSPYDIATELTYGSLEAEDWIRFASDKDGNLQDYDADFAPESYYRNLWAPATFYLQVGNVANGINVHVHLSKDGTDGNGAIILNFTNSQANVCDQSFKFDVPSLWYFKVNLGAGATQDALWAVYR